MSETAIRLSRADDEDGICSLWAMLCKENNRTFDAEKVRATIRRFINRDGGIIAVIGQSTDIRACICILIDPIWFSADIQLVSLFDFVRSDSRSGKLGLKRKLIEYAKRTADELGLEFTTGIFTDENAQDNLEAKLRIYNSLLPKAGEFYRYNPARASA